MTQPHPVIPAKHAWVDESVLVGAGLYILAAVVATPAACDDIRQMLRDLRFKNKPRLHWYEEDDARRHKIAVAIAACDATSLVVIASPMARNGQERARRKCIERLLWQLYEMHQVGHVKFESRTQSQDRSDRHMVAAMRGSRTISSSIRIDFERPVAEPMLWIRDAVAGAVGIAQRGEPELQRVLGERLASVDIQLAP